MAPTPPSKGQDQAVATAPRGTALEFLHDVAMSVSVEFARSKVSVRRILALGKGSVIELEKMAGEPLDVRVNGKLVARGEAVIVNDRFGIRVTEIISPEDFSEGASADI